MMHHLVKKVVINVVLQKKNAATDVDRTYSDFELASAFRELKITIRNLIRDICLIGIGILSASFGLEAFLIPSNFIDGGATGISLLVAEVSGLSLHWLILLINIPFVLLGFKVVDSMFAIKTACAICLLAVAVAVFHYPVITHDKLLVSIFGGMFLGAGIGLSVRGGAVIDGTEVLAVYLSRKIGSTIGDIIILINVFVFLTASYFLSIETALYSMLTYLSASKTLDFIIEGIEEYTGVTIVSSHHEEIRQMIIHVLGRGVTVYSGKRGYGKKGEAKEIDIVYTVITRLEVNKLQTELTKIDPHAFVVMSSVKDTKGGMIKKRALKH